jgi:hypothetical protein
MRGEPFQEQDDLPFKKGFLHSTQMDSVSIIIGSKLFRLARKISLTPEQKVIQIFSPDRSDQALDKRMRDQYIRDRLDIASMNTRSNDSSGESVRADGKKRGNWPFWEADDELDHALT